ncbi:MAG: DNA topoisomerase 3 [Clostridia bacterium]|nr:DNA topoisomerase 3 [Clostridia bacterium]
MKLVVAEKPSVARDIARVLKCGERKDGYMQGGDYMVSWALGHLVTLVEPDELDERYKKWRMEDLPIEPETIPTKVISKTKSQYSVLKKLMNSSEVDSLICATDAGREGELIFRLIYEQAKCKKPVERLWISSMTDEAIREGFATLKPSAEYDGLYRSAQCRANADWLVGMNASRAFTLRYNVLLSMGRVQTPTLAILVKRSKEISDFVPVEYHTLTADFGDYQGQWFDLAAKDEKAANRIPDKDRADALAKKVRGKPARVVSVVSEQKRDLPPQLFDLTSLQREANRQLGFTADKTLKLAQSLYERWKALTYPRTDSRYLPMDMLKRLPKTFQQLPPDYQPLVQGIPRNENGGLRVSRRIFDNDKVSDHHAILPTLNRAPVEKMSADERALFDMVARRAIAAFYPACEYDQTKVVTEAEGEHFRSTGRTERVAGWKEVYRGVGKPDKKEAEPPLPPLSEGDERKVEKAAVKKETTKPPAPHTDASLLSAMENAGRDLDDEALREQMKGSGLGTPATRAAIIERLLQVGYASRKGKTIQATKKGIALIGICPQELASPETTGKWELALNEIAANKRDTERFMQGIRRLSEFLVDYAKSTTVEGGFPEETRSRGKRGGKTAAARKQDLLEGVVCPLCGKPVQESEKAFGCSSWKEGCAFTLWKNCLTRSGGPLLNKKLVTLLLQQKSVRGSTGTLVLDQNTLRFEPSEADHTAVSVPIVYQKKS